MARRQTAAARREAEQRRKAFRNIAIIAAVLGLVGFFYVQAVLSNRALDKETLCPSDPESLTVLLVDVTDPMNLPQRQDFLNQLDRLRLSIPRYGKLVVVKVDPVNDRLLAPIITRCSPGTASDVSDVDGNKQKTQKQWEEGFKKPLDDAFAGIMKASGADRSPILESIQSVNLTELQKFDGTSKRRRLIVASDLLQNTDSISFYQGLPEASALIQSQQFSRLRTDLRGVPGSP
jgi:hypothetical protein